MRVSVKSLCATAQRTIGAVRTAIVRAGKRRLLSLAPATLVFLIAASFLVGYAPAKADDGMFGGMGGGYDPGMIDPGIGGIIDDILGGIADGFGDPGYDNGFDGRMRIIDDFGEPDEGGYYPPTYYPPNYGPPAYSPPQVPRNSAPQPRRTLPRNSEPSVPRNDPPLKHRDIPVPKPRVPTPPKPNPPFRVPVRPLTEDEIRRLLDLTNSQNKPLQHRLVFDPSGDGAAGAVDALGKKLTSQEKEALNKAITEGRPDDVRKALEGKEVDPAAANALVGMARLNQALAQARAAEAMTQAQLRQLNGALQNLQQQFRGLNQQLQNLNQQLQGADRQLQNLNQQLAQEAQTLQQLVNVLNRQNQAINNLAQAVNQLSLNQRLISILLRAIPNTRAIPPGSGIVIVRVPGLLPPGTVAPLGPGSVLAGPRRVPGQPADRQSPYAGPTSITTGNVLRAAGMPRVSGSPIRDSQAAVISDIVLFNRGESPVGFLVDAKTYSLDPSYFQTFRGAASGTVTFDRGTGDTAKYTVAAGTYEFTPVEKGWELYRKNYRATIDNSENPNDFQVMQGETEVLIPAGKTQELVSDYPVAIRFEDGGGKVKEKRLLDGNFLVAAGDDSGQLDLYDPTKIQALEEGKPTAESEDDYLRGSLMNAIEEAAKSESLTPSSTGTRTDLPAPSAQDDNGDQERALVVELIELAAQREKAVTSASKSQASKGQASPERGVTTTRPTAKSPSVRKSVQPSRSISP